MPPSDSGGKLKTSVELTNSVGSEPITALRTSSAPRETVQPSGPRTQNHCAFAFAGCLSLLKFVDDLLYRMLLLGHPDFLNKAPILTFELDRFWGVRSPATLHGNKIGVRKYAVWILFPIHG